MASGGYREGSGRRKGATSMANRLLVKELERTSGPDFAARLQAVLADPAPMPDIVKVQAATCLAAIVFGLARFPNLKLVRRDMENANVA